MGGETTPSRSAVQRAGYGFLSLDRLPSAVVKREYDRLLSQITAT